MKKALKLLIFVILIAGFIYLGKKDYKIDKKKQVINHKTSTVLLDGKSVFTEVNHSKLLSEITEKNANLIFYACVENNKLCALYGNLINEIASNYSISEIYYYDFEKDRKNNNATYQRIITKLSDYLLTDDTGRQNLYSPTLVFIKNGEVYAFDDTLSMYRGNATAKDYYSDEVESERREYLINAFEGYISYE